MNADEVMSCLFEAKQSLREAENLTKEQDIALALVKKQHTLTCSYCT